MASDLNPSSPRPDQSPASQSVAEFMPKVALAGCGYWGKNLARNFASLGALSVVCDANQQVAEGMAEAHGAQAASWQEVLDNPSIAGIALATPAAQHAVMACEAIRAGKDIYVEKPIALKPSDAEEIVALAKEHDRVLMVGHLLQYHPVFLKLKELVKAGEIGRLQYIYSTRLNLGKIRQEEDILWSFAPHDISMILSLMGNEPNRIRAEGSRFLHGRIWDTTITHLDFPGGQSAHIFVSWLHPFKEQRLVVIGEKGMLVFDDTLPWEEKLVRYDHEITWVDGAPTPVKADAEMIAVAQDEPLKLECQHFIDCIVSRETPRTDGAEGLSVLKVLDAATRSLDTGEAGSENAAPKKSAPAGGVFVHETACVDSPVELGSGTKIWHYSHILAGVNIGENCVIGQNVMIGPDVNVGNNCKIQNNVSLYKGITLEDGVFCGPSCVFTNVNNPRAEIERKDEYRPTLVRRGATIGANATIVCGATLGEYAFIAAGAVVTSDVPAFALMAGVPARRTGWMSHDGEKLGDDLVCARSGRKYQETGPDRLEEIRN